jgi:hypothetical protein
MYYVGDDGTVAGRKAIMGALALYLDFINLFLFLIRILGDRREDRLNKTPLEGHGKRRALFA